MRGYVGEWGSVRPCPGYYSAAFEFENGTDATIVYDGYGYFVTAELVPWGHTHGEHRETVEQRVGFRKGILDGTGAASEYTRKQEARAGTHRQWTSRQPSWIPGHLGIVIATCERGDIRQSPHGLYAYDDEGNHEIPVPDFARQVGRAELDELYDAVFNGKPLYHDGAWGLATMEAQMAIIESAKKHRPVRLTHQVAMPAGYAGD